MRAAGFAGFADARRQVQACLRGGDPGYGPRAEALREIGEDRLIEALAEAAQSNARKAFAPSLRDEIEHMAAELLAARSVHCIGVRMA